MGNPTSPSLHRETAGRKSGPTDERKANEAGDMKAESIGTNSDDSAVTHNTGEPHN